MSVDPFIQAPGNGQSINPYSYIMNNPLAGTDPTGYVACFDSIEKAKCAAGGQTGVTSIGEVAEHYAATSLAIGWEKKLNGGNTSSQTGQSTVDIGGQQEVASGDGGVGGRHTSVKDIIENSGIDYDAYMEDLNHDPNDWGQTAFVSNYYMGKNDMEAILAGKLTKADLIERAELFGTAASFVPIGNGARVAFIGLRGAFASKLALQSIKKIDDIFANPRLLEHVSPSQLIKRLNKVNSNFGDSWSVGTLGKGRSKGKGFTLRKWNGRKTDFTDEYIQFHPGTHRHFNGAPYWKVHSGKVRDKFEYLGK